MILSTYPVFFCIIILYKTRYVYTDYCSCNTHIFCLYPTSKPGSDCVGFIQDGYTEKEKKLTLELMNNYRSRVALGDEVLGTPGPQPAAANMMELAWDDVLQSTAQRYADQCIFKHTMVECRKTKNFTFGENLAIGIGGFSKTRHLDHIKAWYDEVADFPYTFVDSYTPMLFKGDGKKQIGHYAQLINAETHLVGCGKSRWGIHDLLVCHFGPTVYSMRPLYLRGSPASLCPSKSFKSSYYGLCTFVNFSDRPNGSHSSVLIIFSFVFVHILADKRCK